MAEVMGLLRRWLNRGTATAPAAGDLLVLRSAPELLLAHDSLLSAIRRQVGVPEAHWNTLYYRLFESFAAFVQQLPASEAHHHHDPGGLLAHGLQVTLSALTLRRGVLLPAGASAEELAEKQDVWTYATATAALLHDIGKPLCDQRIALFDVNGKSLGLWDGLSGRMAAPAVAYRMQFRRGRRYRLHARLPPLLVHHIVPPSGLRWLTSDMNVFEAWVATISGIDDEISGELGKLIRSADGLSVASDLTGVQVTRAPQGAPKPLAERLATGLRFLVDQGRLPLNKPGAAGWVSGDALWLVSKRALDALREHLLNEAQSGVPARNDRLMDELQSHGLVSVNGDRAIWNATVQVGSWSVSLTLLRVPLARLWPEAESRPPTFDGTVVPDVGIPTDEQAVVMGSPSPAGSAESLAPVHSARVAMAAASSMLSPEIAADPLPVEADHDEIAVNATETVREVLCHESGFVAWLREGIVTGRLKTNAADARVHYVEEGLLLVSPAVFRDFAGVTGWESAQKKLLKLRIHRKTAQGTNVWTYRVVGETKSGALLRGIVIPDPQTRLGIVVTRINPVLHRVTDVGVATTPSSAEVFPVETPPA
ncbi:MAG: MobH family relaxase [Panacagrimonas sp.]